MSIRLVSKKYRNNVVVSTVIILLLVWHLIQQGVQSSYKLSANFIFAEIFVVVLTLLTVGIFETTKIKSNIKFRYSLALLICFAILAGYFMMTFMGSGVSLLFAIVVSVIFKIINSHKNFDMFKRRMYKTTLAVTYTMLLFILLAMITAPSEYYFRAVPLITVIIYLMMTEYFLPKKYDTIKLSRLGPLGSVD